MRFPCRIRVDTALRTSALAVALWASGCGGPPTGPDAPISLTRAVTSPKIVVFDETDSQLTEDDAVDLASRTVLTSIAALKAGVEAGALRTSSVPPLDAATPTVVTPRSVQQIGYRITCALGGRTEVTGNITRNLDGTLSGIVQVDLRQTFTDCTFSPAAGVIRVINGDPYLTVSGTLSYLNGAPSTQQHLRWDGALQWLDVATGATGRCDANQELNLPTLASPITRITGTWCFPISAVPPPGAEPFGNVEPIAGLPGPQPLPLLFNVPGALPNAIIGRAVSATVSVEDLEPVPGAVVGAQSGPPVFRTSAYEYSFCQPAPAPGRLCGGPLADNPPTSNPTGGTPHYTFSMGVGHPFGLVLDQNGVLRGTATTTNTAGRTYTFDVCVTDQGGQKVCKPASIRVEHAPLEMLEYRGQFTCDRAGSGYRCTGTITVTLNRPIDAGTRVRAEIENSSLGATLTSNGTDTVLRFTVDQSISSCPFRNPDAFRLMDLGSNAILGRGGWEWNSEGCGEEPPPPTSRTFTYSGRFDGSFQQVFRGSLGTCTWQIRYTGRMTLTLQVRGDAITSGSMRMTDANRYAPPGSSSNPGQLTCTSSNLSDNRSATVTGTLSDIRWSDSQWRFSGRRSGSAVTGSMTAIRNDSGYTNTGSFSVNLPIVDSTDLDVETTVNITAR